mmetsp:Transcript_22117/g.61989  ORF Transcript_22117/g.61989 Transcript_22117/m.61989 type:complete len:273 (+) Transcript_22117:897-1715(+)
MGLEGRRRVVPSPDLVLRGHHPFGAAHRDQRSRGWARMQTDGLQQTQPRPPRRDEVIKKAALAAYPITDYRVPHLHSVQRLEIDVRVRFHPHVRPQSFCASNCEQGGRVAERAGCRRLLDVRHGVVDDLDAHVRAPDLVLCRTNQRGQPRAEGARREVVQQVALVGHSGRESGAKRIADVPKEGHDRPARLEDGLHRHTEKKQHYLNLQLKATPESAKVLERGPTLGGYAPALQQAKNFGCQEAEHPQEAIHLRGAEWEVCGVDTLNGRPHP